MPAETKHVFCKHYTGLFTVTTDVHMVLGSENIV